MSLFTLVYGMRLYHGPPHRRGGHRTHEGRAAGGEGEWRVTGHVIEGGSREEIKRQLIRSIEAFFELH